MPLVTMSIKESYPNIEKWVSHGGTLDIRTVADYRVEVAVGDAGGVPEDCHLVADSVDAALEQAETLVEKWMEETKRLLEELLEGNPKVTDLEFLQVPGWPPVKNPYYGEGEA